MAKSEEDLYKAIDRKSKLIEQMSSLVVKVGFQHGMATYEDDDVDVCDVAAWNELGTSRTPARPFMYDSMHKNEDEIRDFMTNIARKVVVEESMDVEAGMKMVGLFQKDKVQESITEGDFVPNAPYTIKKKGSDHPLIDTGRMRQSVNYVIKKKE